MPEEEMTLRPTIDPDSPPADDLRRRKAFLRLLPKHNRFDYGKMYRVLSKFRDKQRKLLGEDDIEDPDPFDSSYVFYCFTGKLVD